MRALVALGSNLGDRAGHIARAVRALEALTGAPVRTASLYESDAAYVEDQPSFLNSVCELRTSLPPRALLAELKRIERELGRRAGGPRWGPREVDLDLLLCGDAVVREDGSDGDGAPPLELPHPRLAERDFVLQPLAELAPHAVHPILRLSAAELRDRLGRPALRRVTPLLDGTVLRWGERTRIMGVLNVTPDSFSDGGEHVGAAAAVERGLELCALGADILDVGAQSTRPGATTVSAEEEIARAVPVVEGLRAAGCAVPISVDTFWAAVADDLVGRGASIVNDVSGGARDPAMLPALAALGCPGVLMHMRGTPGTMQSLAAYGEDVAGEVAAELAGRLAAAEAAGVRRWSLLSDPGIGFAKDAAQSVAVLRALERFGSGALGYPMVLGVSRKSFIGHLLGGVPPKERAWGTAAACAAAIPHADVLRVHDVAEMKQLATVCDAICR